MVGKILLVEADAMLGAVIEEVLRHSGYEVIFRKTLLGEVGHLPSLSLVILDIDTTPADMEVAWLDTRGADDESLPIILMGVQAPEDRHHLLREHLSRRQTNALVWVKKPFRNKELLAAVRQVQGSSLLR